VPGRPALREDGNGRSLRVAESVIHKQLVLGELLDLTSFTNVCRTFVDLYKVGLKVFDANGTKLVDMKVASGDFCAYMFTGPNGRRLCTETVTHIKVRPLEAPNAQPALAVRNCFSGLRYLMMPILYEGDMLGRIIFGPFMPEEVGDLGAELQALQGEFDLKKAKELIDRIRRAPETTVRRILEHFAKLVDVLVFTSHKAPASSTSRASSRATGRCRRRTRSSPTRSSGCRSCRGSSPTSSPPSRTSCARRSPR